MGIDMVTQGSGQGAGNHRLPDEVELIRSAFQAVPDALIIYDLVGKPLAWNPAYRLLVECDDDEIRRRMAWDFHPPEDVEFVSRTFMKVLETGEPSYIEAGVKTGTGRVIPCWLSGSALRNGRGETIGLCGVGRDLTVQKRAEAIYGIVLRSAMDGFCVNGMDGTLLEINDSYCEMLGYTREEILGLKKTDVEVSMTEREIEEHMVNIMRSGHDRFETRHRRKDGGIIDVEASVTYKDIDGGRLYSFIRDVTERKNIEAEILAHRNNLEDLVRERTRELEELNARLLREVAEREIVERELRRVNEELEDYTRMVSHELRTPLSGILLALEYLERLAGTMSIEGLDKEMASIVESAKKAVAATESQVDRLLTLARAGQVPAEVVEVDVALVVEDICGDLAQEVSRKGVTVTAGGDLGTVRADPLHIRLVFSNLLSNALKYCVNPEPVIEISLLDILPDGGKKYLFRDNGTGLPGDLSGDLSDPRALKREVKSGLGLAIVTKIVRIYNGSLFAYNDGGACFEISLHEYER